MGSSTQAINSILQELGRNMVAVKGGILTIGCTSEEKYCIDYGKPERKVSLSSYKIGKYEVSQAEWEAVTGTNPSYHKNCPTCPVEQVSWNDIQAFLKKLNEKTGKKYRLLTEAEWEYAARGGANSKGYQYAAINDQDEVARNSGDSGYETYKVGQRQPNKLGLHDVSGNVWEWCSDIYSDSSSRSTTNVEGLSSGSNRVFCGGTCNYYADFCRVVSYRKSEPANSYYFIGFRLAL